MMSYTPSYTQSWSPHHTQDTYGMRRQFYDNEQRAVYSRPGTTTAPTPTISAGQMLDVMIAASPKKSTTVSHQHLIRSGETLVGGPRRVVVGGGHVIGGSHIVGGGTRFASPTRTRRVVSAGGSVVHETVGTQPVLSGPTRIIAAPTTAAMPSHQVLVQQQPQLHHHQFLQPVPQQIVRLPNGECSCHVAPPPPPRVVCRQIDPCEESQMAAQAYQQAAVWNYQIASMMAMYPNRPGPGPGPGPMPPGGCPPPSGRPGCPPPCDPKESWAQIKKVKLMVKEDGKVYEKVPDKKNGGYKLVEYGIPDNAAGSNRKVTTSGAIRAEVSEGKK